MSGASNRGGRDLWSLIEAEHETSTVSTSSAAVVLFTGDQSCGKSTIIQSFLKPNVTKEPKPTFALEYSFARKKAASNNPAGKTVAHIWELGGEINNPGFYDIAITPRTITDASIAICIDLSKPQNVFLTLKTHMDLLKNMIRRRISELQTMEASSPIIQALRNYAARPLGEHVDTSKLKLFELPIFFISTKFDLFKNLPLQDRRLVYQIIRFFANYYGATIITSSNDASQKDTLRGIISNICFQNTIKTIYEVAPEKPLFVSPGQDTFESILLGNKGASESDSKVCDDVL